MAVTLPLVLMILDWYPLRRIGSLREAMASAAGKWPFFAGSVAVGLVTVMAQREAGSLPNFHSVPVLSRALVASWSLVMYLVKTVVPLDLSPLYPYPTDISIAMPRYAGSVIAVVAVTAAAAVAARRQRSWLALWSCFLVMLLPVLGLFQVGYHSMADRFTYLPGLALFLPAGIGAATAWERTRGRAQRGVMAAGAAAVLVLLCILTVRQTAVWKDSITLWSTVIDRYPDRVPLAYINRGAAFAEDHDADRALRDFDTAIRLAPDSAMAYMNRGRALQDRGRTDAAIADYTKAIGLMPSYALAYTNRGSAYQRTGRTSEALEDFSRAVRLSADDAAAYLNRGILYGELGRFALALEDLSAALRANPFSVDAYTARGLVLERSGEPVKALADLDAALALDPANANARLDRGVVLERLGRLDEAAEDYGRAAAADPTDAQAFAGLGRIRKAQGRCDEAVADLSRALSLRTDVSGALLDRAGCYRALGQALLAAQDYRMACERGEEAGCAALMSGPGRGGAR
jgi:tetratricopeptide (TPR) repeat protein